MASNTAPRKGDRARVSRCSEGDHEGRTNEVPQEERSTSMYITRNVCIIVKRNFNLIYKHCWKTNIQAYVVDVCICTFSYCQLISFHVQIMSYNNRCLFSQVEINHESNEFILDPGTVANTFKFENTFDPP
jgi:hypothetical protein